jgi:hypothetical protein
MQQRDATRTQQQERALGPIADLALLVLLVLTVAEGEQSYLSTKRSLGKDGSSRKILMRRGARQGFSAVLCSDAR